MGKIKDANKKYYLNAAEFKYVKSIYDSRSRIFQEQSQVISAFLKYVASGRLGLPADADLQFEMDFEDEAHELKIEILQREGDNV